MSTVPVRPARSCALYLTRRPGRPVILGDPLIRPIIMLASKNGYCPTLAVGWPSRPSKIQDGLEAHPTDPQSSPATRRPRFRPDCLRLACRRRSTDPRVGRVARRRLGGLATASSIARSFSKQSCEFRGASRKRWLVTSSSPSLVSRLPYFSKKRSRTASGREGVLRTPHRSVALLFTLLTFCPPGPPLRAKVISNSRQAGMRTWWFTTSIGKGPVQLFPHYIESSPTCGRWVGNCLSVGWVKHGCLCTMVRCRLNRRKLAFDAFAG